ncbi:MAG: T9SS type A sorting domain-containing protein [Flavobacteriales bacterium]
MKIKLLAAMCLVTTCAWSQELPYSLSVLNESYNELSESASAVDNEVWDDPYVILPLDFEFQLMDEVMSEILIAGPGGQVVNYLMQDSVHFLAPYLADLMDAGYDSTSISPILYKTEGNPGSRIFKLEYRNTGFYNEWAESETFDNRVSFQLWLYEGTNVIEYRFGENAVTQSTLVHFVGAPLIGIGSKADVIGNGGWENFWLLHGDPLAPQIFNLQNPFETPPLLDSEPPAGTVYRFSPLFAGIKDSASEPVVQFYPTLVQNQITITLNDDNTSVHILDMSGKLILSQTIQRGSNLIDLSSLPGGQYILQIKGDKSDVIQRITKL